MALKCQEVKRAEILKDVKSVMEEHLQKDGHAFGFLDLAQEPLASAVACEIYGERLHQQHRQFFEQYLKYGDRLETLEYDFVLFNLD